MTLHEEVNSLVNNLIEGYSSLSFLNKNEFLTCMEAVKSINQEDLQKAVSVLMFAFLSFKNKLGADHIAEAAGIAINDLAAQSE